ncbi:MAG: DUF6448 family protein [Candidatus Omnitrophota bacterium]
MKVNGLFVVLFAIGCVVLISNYAFAHCDTLDGPVIQDARVALEKGDATPVLKWVKREAEPEIKAAFDKALLERKTNKEAADMIFFETLVRIHRAGEGVDFTGLKPVGAVDPAVAKADEAIEKESVDELAKKISDMVFGGIKERFKRVIETKKHMNESVEAGREYVAAYVEFVHYVEGIHMSIKGKDAHGHGGDEKMQ